MSNASPIRAQDLFTIWYDDALQFVIDVYGVTPEKWQAQALTTVSKHDRLSIRSGHGVGKTALLAWICRWFHVTRGAPLKIPCTAPTSHQLEDVLWAELAKWMKKEPKWIRSRFELKADRLILNEDPLNSFAVARTSRQEQPEALQGFHEDNLLFLIDEAPGIPDKIFEVAEGSLTTPGAKIVMTGNPTRTQGYFYDSHHRVRKLWHTMKVSCFDVERPGMKKYIESQRARYGEDSNVWRARVLGEFPKGDDDTVIPLHLVEAAMVRNVKTTNAPVIWGLDIARFGDDRCALAKRKGNTLLEKIKTWRGKDLMQTTGMVTEEYIGTPDEQKPKYIMADVIGIGSGVVDRLRENGLPVRGVNVAETAPIKERFSRCRDELWWRAREFFEAKDCKIPEDDQDLVDELIMPKYTHTSTGKIVIESKDSVKKRTMFRQSPDVADAFVLTFMSLAITSKHRKPLKYPRLRVV